MKYKFILYAIVILLLSACTGNTLKYRDASLPVDLRVKDLLGRMTIEEKLAQMRDVHLSLFFKDNVLDTVMMDSALQGISYGVLFNSCIPAENLARCIADVKKYSAEKTRLGIPMLSVSEALHGIVHEGATIFPHSIAMGSTFDPTLMGMVADAIATESKAVGLDQVLAPVLDVARELRWGRVEETFGEDPYLISRMGVEYVKSLHKNGIITTPKHFTAHGSPLGGLNLASVAGGERELRSIYLKPFAAVICETNPYSIMNSYNSYDGLPLASSKHILTDILRNELGFNGYIFADWGSTGMLWNFHRTAENPEDAARQAVLAGLDMEIADNCYTRLDQLLKTGDIKMSDIDKCVARILKVKFAMGLFENPNIPDANSLKNRIHTPENVTLALKAARESAILLQNKGNLLPLDASNLRSLAVIGPNAAQVQFGDYTWTNDNIHGVTPLQGIKALVGTKIKINYAKGCDIHTQDRSGFAEAVAVALASDVTVVFIGATSAWPGLRLPNAVSGESYDLSDIALTGVQEELVKAVKATGKPVVVVLVSGKPSAIPWIKENCEGIIVQWYGGEQQGNAIAEILFGQVNPSGKLNVSFPRSTGHLPCFYNHYPSDKGYYHNPGSPGSPGNDYVFSSPEPLWAFGHGLSYTTFEYVSMNVSKETFTADETCTIEVELKNTGSRDGKEVVQLYVRDVVSSVVTPVKELKRFEKLFVKAGETAKVTFELPMSELSLWNADMQEVVEPGEFILMAGTASDNILQTKTITVK